MSDIVTTLFLIIVLLIMVIAYLQSILRDIEVAMVDERLTSREIRTILRNAAGNADTLRRVADNLRDAIDDE